MKKLAIIGSSVGQRLLPVKAKELGLETLCFSWEEGAVKKNDVDYFYPISIKEMDEIYRICKEMNVCGIISNASNICQDTVNYVGEKLDLHTNHYDVGLRVKDKFSVRQLTNGIDELNPVNVCYYNDGDMVTFPCIVKPVVGGGKIGVSLVKDSEELAAAVAYCQKMSVEKIIVEQYVSGKEVSVETLSYEGNHQVIQVTDKENSGAPHFVELGHHQPAMLSEKVYSKIRRIIPKILDAIGFVNGAAHIEMKVGSDEELFLIEVNPRGGGDEISNNLVYLSTGFDYVKAMIEVAIGEYKPIPVKNLDYSGILYLCEQTKDRLPFFQSDKQYPWIVEKKLLHDKVEESFGNWDRAGYVMYRNDRRVETKDLLSEMAL